jgi:phosphoribosylformylglycinamidine cyclo-ligase
MLRTFNMGVGLIVVVPADKFSKARALLNRAEEKFHVIGRIVKGDRSGDKAGDRRVHFV